MAVNFAPGGKTDGGNAAISISRVYFAVWVAGNV